MPEEKKHGSPEFYRLLEEMRELHDKKSHDYATDSNPYGNYNFAGLVANLFSHSPHDAGFAGRLAEKVYRLSVLEGGRKTPLNESIDDTERDIAVIAVLWMAARRDSRAKKQFESLDSRITSLEPPPPTQPTPFRCRSCEREFHDRQRIEVGNKFYCSNICAKLGSGSRVGYHICRYCNATLSTKYVTDSTSNIFCDAKCRDNHWHKPHTNG